MLSRKSLRLYPDREVKTRVGIQENLFVKCVYARLVRQRQLRHTWRHMVAPKLSNVDSVKNHIYLQQIQKLTRIVVHKNFTRILSFLRLLRRPLPVIEVSTYGHEVDQVRLSNENHMKSV